MSVNLKELVDMVELVSMGGAGQTQAYLCRESGKIYCRMDPLLVGDLDDDLPDDIEDEEKYIPLPGASELDLGKSLVMDFVGQVLPADFDEVRDMFRKKGAYRRIKDLMIRRGVRDQWYDFERKATERALREWCELNSIKLSD